MKIYTVFMVMIMACVSAMPLKRIQIEGMIMYSNPYVISEMKITKYKTQIKGIDKNNTPHDIIISIEMPKIFEQANTMQPAQNINMSGLTDNVYFYSDKVMIGQLVYNGVRPFLFDYVLKGDSIDSVKLKKNDEVIPIEMGKAIPVIYRGKKGYIRFHYMNMPKIEYSPHIASELPKYIYDVVFWYSDIEL